MGVTQYFWSLPARKTKKRSEPFIVSEMEFTRLEIKGPGEGAPLNRNNKRETELKRWQIEEEDSNPHDPHPAVVPLEEPADRHQYVGSGEKTPDEGMFQ